jgi:virulence-associated protein VagC
MTNLKFVRRLSRSVDNKASVITIPRSIALAWEQYNTVDLIFNGDSLVITPSNGSKLPREDQDAW